MATEVTGCALFLRELIDLGGLFDAASLVVMELKGDQHQWHLGEVMGVVYWYHSHRLPCHGKKRQDKATARQQHNVQKMSMGQRNVPGKQM